MVKNQVSFVYCNCSTDHMISRMSSAAEEWYNLEANFISAVDTILITSRRTCVVVDASSPGEVGQTKHINSNHFLSMFQDI